MEETSSLHNSSKLSHSTWCSAPNCHNSRAKKPEFAFFRFPTAVDRCKRWLLNTRRTDLMKKDFVRIAKTRSLCEEHFEASQFMNPNDKGVRRPRKRLRWDAVPTIFNYSSTEQGTLQKTKKSTINCDLLGRKEFLDNPIMKCKLRNGNSSSSTVVVPKKSSNSKNLLLSTNCSSISFNSLFFDVFNQNNIIPDNSNHLDFEQFKMKNPSPKLPENKTELEETQPIIEKAFSRINRVFPATEKLVPEEPSSNNFTRANVKQQPEDCELLLECENIDDSRKTPTPPLSILAASLPTPLRHRHGILPAPMSTSVHNAPAWITESEGMKRELLCCAMSAISEKWFVRIQSSYIEFVQLDNWPKTTTASIQLTVTDDLQCNILVIGHKLPEDNPVQKQVGEVSSVRDFKKLLNYLEKLCVCYGIHEDNLIQVFSRGGKTASNCYICQQTLCLRANDCKLLSKGSRCMNCVKVSNALRATML